MYVTYSVKKVLNNKSKHSHTTLSIATKTVVIKINNKEAALYLTFENPS